MLDRAFLRGVQRFGRSRVGGRIGRGAYRFAAEVAAVLLARVPGVDSVYATGSLTRPAQLQPGYSDIDLVLLATLPTVDDELRLRDGVARVQRALNVLGPLFRNLDYLETRDLDLYRASGNVWALDLDRRWQCLAGNNRLDPQRTPPSQHQRVERLVRLLRRWFKVSSKLLRLNASGESSGARDARRLLGDALAARLDWDRLEPLERLLSSTDPTAGGEALGRILRSGIEFATVAGLVSATLEVIEGEVERVTKDWPEAIIAAPFGNSADGELERTARLGDELGFASACVLRRATDDHVLLVVAKGDTRAADTVECFRELLRQGEQLPRTRFPWLEWPVLVTPRLFEAAYLFEASLGDPSVVPSARGQPLPRVRVPPDAERKTFDAARRLSIFVRARGRRFRTDLSREQQSATFRRELERLGTYEGWSTAEPDLLEHLRARLDKERRATNDGGGRTT